MAGPEFKHSTVLFQTENGQPLKFYCVPGETRTQIHPLVTHGGGVLTSRSRDENSIKLAVEGQTARGDDVYSYKYILDCAEKNKLLPLEQYKMKDTRSAVPSSKVSVTTSGKGREKFLKREQIAILKYVAENGGPGRPMGGNKIWKEMARSKVTKHSWQSMKDHYHKYLKGKEHLFDMDPRMKYQKLDLGNQAAEDGDSANDAPILLSDNSISNRDEESTNDAQDSLSDDANKDDSMDIDMFDSSPEEENNPGNPTAKSPENAVLPSEETKKTDTPSNRDQGSAGVNVLPTDSPIRKSPARSPSKRSPKKGGQKHSQDEVIPTSSVSKEPPEDTMASPKKEVVVVRVGGEEEKLSPGVQSTHSASSDDMDRYLNGIAVELDKSRSEEGEPTSSQQGTTMSSPKKPVVGKGPGTTVQTADNVKLEDVTIPAKTGKRIPTKKAAQAEQEEEDYNLPEKRGRLEADVDKNATQDGKEHEEVNSKDIQEEQQAGSAEDAQEDQREESSDNVQDSQQDGSAEDDPKDEGKKKRRRRRKRKAGAAQYVMETQESQGTSQGGNRRDEDDEGHMQNVLDGCVKIKNLMSEFNLSLLMATRALYHCHGRMDATRHFLRTGKKPDDLPTGGWSNTD